MSKAKFTKGSWVGFNNGKWSDCGAWSVDNDEASSYSNVAVNVEDVTICLVVSDSWNDEEIEANAHLIAAAPDMYATLNEVRDFIASDINCGPCGLGLVVIIDELLAKARGEK